MSTDFTKGGISITCNRITKKNTQTFSYLMFMSLIVSIAGELNFYPFNDAFRISFGMPTFFFCLLLFKEIPALFSGIFVGIFVVGFRVFIDIPNLDFNEAFIKHYPTFFYYFTFGLLFTLTKINRYSDSSIFVGLLGIIFDIVSSVAELLFQYIAFDSPFYYDDIKKLSVVAIFRSYFVIGFFNLIYLNNIRSKSEKIKRLNEDLIIIISNMYQEAINLQKVLTDSENVTKKSYYLYQQIIEIEKNINQVNPKVINFVRKLSLEVSGEAHEIKKDNQRIFSSLSKLISDKEHSKYMEASDLIYIIINSNKQYARMLDKNISIKSQINGYHSKYHAYKTLSIMNNLVSNAIEAIQKEGEILLGVESTEKFVLFKVKDNGPGVPEKFKRLIFNPGFTTKYNKKGIASTGIGLSYVKELVTQLDGEIKLYNESEETLFIVRIPLINMTRKGC